MADDASAPAVDACRQAFASRVLEHVAMAGEATVEGGQGLGQVARIDALYTILDWDNRPDREATRYLTLNEFKDRDVLPTPHWVVGKPEPAWRGEPPSMRDTAPEMRSAPSRRDAKTPATRRRPPEDRRRHQRPDARDQRARRVPESANPPVTKRSTIRPGDEVRCEALEERTKKGAWRFRTLGLPEQRVGFLQPGTDAPPNLEPGRQLDLIVAQAPTDPDLSWTFRWQPSSSTS